MKSSYPQIRPKLPFSSMLKYRLGKSHSWYIASASALMVLLMGVMNLLSAWIGIEHTRLKILNELLPLEVNQGSRTLTVIAGLLLIWLSWSLKRRKHHAWVAAVFILALSCLLHLLKGLDYEEALCAAAILAGLLLVRREFIVRSDPASWGNALLAALAILLLSLLTGIAGFALLQHHFTPAFSLVAAVQSTLALLSQFAIPVLQPLSDHRDARWFSDTLVITGMSSSLLIAGILLQPVAKVIHLFDHEREEVKRLLRHYGGPPLAYWVLLPAMHYFFHPRRRAVIAYRVVQSTAIVLGDPIGDENDIPELISNFAEHCYTNDWRPAWYQVSGRWMELFSTMHWVAIKIGEDAIVPLSELSFSGKSWQDIRTALNRLPREGYSAVWYDLSKDERGWLPALTDISTNWLHRQHGEEKVFSLGSWETAQRFSYEQRLLVLQNSDANPVALLTFVPQFGAPLNWVLDLMRKNNDLPAGAIEYLLAIAMQQFQQEGATQLSLGLSPLADITAEDAAATPEVLERVRTLIARHFSNIYNFSGLQNFKDKFHPQWQARYLVYPTQTILPKVLLALMTVHQGKKSMVRDK